MLHKNITGASAVHQAAYFQSADPGAVGPLKFWIDTTVGPPYTLKVRKADDSGWEFVGTLGADEIDVSTAADGQFLKRVGGVWVGSAVDKLDGEDVDLSSAADGDFLQRQSGIWTPISSIDGASLDDGSVDVDKINATGTPDNTTYLRGDGAWATPAGGGGGSSETIEFPPAGSPHADDDEFEGSLDVSWTETLTAAPTVSHDSRWPSHYYARMTGSTQAAKLEKTIVAAGDVAYTAKVRGLLTQDFAHINLGVFDSSFNNGAYAQFIIASFAGGLATRLLTVDSGSVNDRGIASVVANTRELYLHIQNVSNTWTAWFSYDSWTWFQTASHSKTFTAGKLRLELQMAGQVNHQSCGFDWVRRDLFVLPS